MGNLAHAIAARIAEPVVVLDSNLRVLSANNSFFEAFGRAGEDPVGKTLGALGAGEWQVPGLADLLKRVACDQAAIEGYEVELSRAGAARRVIRLNARKLYCEHENAAALLLNIQDITERGTAERRTQQAVEEKDLLLREMELRIGNSLQIIADILLIKAQEMPLQETRLHLQDAHKRVLAIAAVQNHLHVAPGSEGVAVGPFLKRLSADLASAMIGDSSLVSIDVQADEGVASAQKVLAMGLVVTELIINALKHAFPDQRAGFIVVAYSSRADGWTLSVSDNGVGKSAERAPSAGGGLGTNIVTALTAQLAAQVKVRSDAKGTSISMTHTA